MVFKIQKGILLRRSASAFCNLQKHRNKTTMKE